MGFLGLPTPSPSLVSDVFLQLIQTRCVGCIIPLLLDLKPQQIHCHVGEVPLLGGDWMVPATLMSLV